MVLMSRPHTPLRWLHSPFPNPEEDPMGPSMVHGTPCFSSGYIFQEEKQETQGRFQSVVRRSVGWGNSEQPHQPNDHRGLLRETNATCLSTGQRARAAHYKEQGGKQMQLTGTVRREEEGIKALSSHPGLLCAPGAARSQTHEA